MGVAWRLLRSRRASDRRPKADSIVRDLHCKIGRLTCASKICMQNTEYEEFETRRNWPDMISACSVALIEKCADPQAFCDHENGGFEGATALSDDTHELTRNPEGRHMRMCRSFTHNSAGPARQPRDRGEPASRTSRGPGLARTRYNRPLRSSLVHLHRPLCPWRWLQCCRAPSHLLPPRPFRTPQNRR